MKKSTFAVAAIISYAWAEDSGSRTISFTNYCQETVWIGFAGDVAESKQSGSEWCHSDKDCHDGTTCVKVDNM